MCRIIEYNLTCDGDYTKSIAAKAEWMTRLQAEYRKVNGDQNGDLTFESRPVVFFYTIEAHMKRCKHYDENVEKCRKPSGSPEKKVVRCEDFLLYKDDKVWRDGIQALYESVLDSFTEDELNELVLYHCPRCAIGKQFEH